MSFFRSWRSHYTAGYLLGLMLRSSSPWQRRYAIHSIDRWAWAREWQQNLDANNPNEILSKRQQKEAMAFGAGARAATGVTDLPYPQPPYYGGTEWS